MLAFNPGPANGWGTFAIIAGAVLLFGIAGWIANRGSR